MAWYDEYALKAGVDPANVTAELIAGLEIARRVYYDHGAPLTSTSLTEGQHMAGSRHYTGQAADLRTRDIAAATVLAIVDDLGARLGPAYRVILESDHIHIQHQGTGTAPEPRPPATPPYVPGAYDASPFDLTPFFGDPQDASGAVERSQIAGVSTGAVLFLLLAAGLVWYFSD